MSIFMDGKEVGLNTTQKLYSEYTAGDNIKIENSVISYKNDEYEHIMDFIVGYSVLTEKPSNWETNYTDYYKNMGTAKEPNYQALAELETWETGKYYSFSTNDSGVFELNREPNGAMFKFKKVKVFFDTPPCTVTDSETILVYWNYGYNWLWSPHISNVKRKDQVSMSLINIERQDENTMRCEGYSKTNSGYPDDAKVGLNRHSEILRHMSGFAFYYGFPANTKITIYAVRGSYE